jgi:hypothetical protein
MKYVRYDEMQTVYVKVSYLQYMIRRRRTRRPDASACSLLTPQFSRNLGVLYLSGWLPRALLIFGVQLSVGMPALTARLIILLPPERGVWVRSRLGASQPL